MSKPPVLAVFSRKDYEKLSTSQVESRASGPSKWAKALLEKQGWKEGSGLGKEGSGLTSHVKVARRDGTTAIGYKAPPAGSAEVMGGGGGSINSDQPASLPYSSRSCSSLLLPCTTNLRLAFRGCSAGGCAGGGCRAADGTTGCGAVGGGCPWGGASTLSLRVCGSCS